MDWGRNYKKSYTILHDIAQIGKINEKKTQRLFACKFI